MRRRRYIRGCLEHLKFRQGWAWNAFEDEF
jgi:hypothetical protein